MPLKPFFTEEILGRFRMVNLLQTGGTIPTPPFYEKILATNSSLLPDPAHSVAEFWARNKEKKQERSTRSAGF
jgi:hypothetical protein